MKKKDWLNLVILILVLSFAAYKFVNKKYVFQDSAFLMDTIIDIKITTKDKQSESVIDSTFKLIENYENKFSYYNYESLIYRFNNNEIDYLELDDDLKEIFAYADSLFIFSDSLFDVTIGSLTEIWKTHIPTEDSILIAMSNTGFQKLLFKDGKLTKPNEMKINLGSLVKGFIVDKAVEYLKENSVDAGFVNAGGDMRIFGEKNNIGIQHPRELRTELIGVLSIKDKAVVTSGDYERFFIKDGVRYHHIINPKTGYPAQNTVSVTVISDEAVLADAYSTGLFMMNVDSALKLVENTNDLEALIIYKNGEELFVKQSKGFDQFLTEWNAADIMYPVDIE